MFHVKHYLTQWRWWHWVIPAPAWHILKVYGHKRDLERGHGRSFSWDEYNKLCADHSVCPNCNEVTTGMDLAAGSGLCHRCYKAHQDGRAAGVQEFHQALTNPGDSLKS